MGKLLLGLQLYSVYDDVQRDRLGTLKRIKEMGYDVIELVGLASMDPHEMKADCEAAGLLPLSAHVPVKELSEDPAAVVQKYAGVGCRHLVFPWADPPFMPGGEKYEDFLSLIKTVASEARKYGMTVSYHNHKNEIEKDGESCLFDRLMSDTSPSDLQTEIDTLWVLCAEEDPASFLRRYTGRAPLVHFKDYNGKKGDAFEFRTIGEGMQNIPELVAVAAVIGAEAIIVEQDKPTPGMTALECAAMSAQYLRALL